MDMIFPVITATVAFLIVNKYMIPQSTKNEPKQLVQPTKPLDTTEQMYEARVATGNSNDDYGTRTNVPDFSARSGREISSASLMNMCRGKSCTSGVDLYRARAIDETAREQARTRIHWVRSNPHRSSIAQAEPATLLSHGSRLVGPRKLYRADFY